MNKLQIEMSFSIMSILTITVWNQAQTRETRIPILQIFVMYRYIITAWVTSSPEGEQSAQAVE